MNESHSQSINSLGVYKTMLSSLHEGVMLLDHEGNVKRANQSAADLLDVSFDQLLQMNTFTSNWHAIKSSGEPYMADELPINQSILKGIKIEGAIIGVRFPTQIKWFVVNTNRIHVPDLPKGFGGLITFTNITKTVEANQDLLESEQRYKKISEMTSDFIFFVAIESEDKHQIIWSSGNLHAILGVSPSLHIDLPYGYVARVHSEDQPTFIAAMRPLYKNKGADNIHRIITPNGIKWIECHLSPIYSDSKKRVT